MGKKVTQAGTTGVASNKTTDNLFIPPVYDITPESYDFKTARSEIRAQDGHIIFGMDNIQVPEDWSQVATDILAQKYFRKSGVPNKTIKVPQANVPQWLWPSVPADDAVFGSETEAMQVFHRLAGCWTYWGWKGKYFKTEAQAKSFYSQMVYMLFAQICAPNSPQWFNTGLHWAYGIDGPSQGHYYYDVIRAGTTHQDPVVEAKTSYERPQTSACQPYNALISTPNGLIKIGDIVTKNLIGTKVYDSTDITKVVAVKANGVKKVYRVVLQSGHTIEATADHLILVSDRKGRGAEYRALADIEPGDYLTYRANTSIKNSKVSKRLEAEAFLAGWLQSDGFVGQYTYGTNQSLTLEFITVNNDEYDAVKNALSIVFPKEHYNIINVPSENSELDIWRIRLYGEQFRDFVSKYNLMLRGVDMEVPEDILHGPLPIQQAYLKAVFQADGYVSTREASPVIGLAMISTTLVNQIHLMLANMGIYSRICTKIDSRNNRHDTRCINIQVESERTKFSSLIGFVSEEKLSKVVSTLNGSGRVVGETKWFKVERIEYIGKQEVYDIQTESEHYLCGNIVVHNCFIQSIKDDLVNTNGIVDTFLKEARLFKYGSGTGTNFSNLRGSGEKLSGGGRSSGVMSFLKIGDVSAGSIKSGGTTRRAAKMVLLDIDHPDIETFIDWKVKEERKVAAIITGAKINKKFLQEVYDARVQNDERALSKAIGNARKNFVSDNYIHRTIQQADMGADFSFEEFNTDFNSEAYSTVSGQNSNNSIRISDSFINLTLLDSDKDDTFNLINRTDGAVNKQVSAKQIWRKICEAAWHSADPGIQFDDTINEWHTCKTAGRINASNPCQPANAKVLTPNGIRTFADVSIGSLIWTGNRWSKIIRKISTGIKSVYVYHTTAGRFIGTKDHKIFQNGQRIKVKKAEGIDRCLGPIPTKVNINLQDVMDGWVIGDGSYHKAPKKICLNIGENDFDIFEKLSEYIIKQLHGLGSIYTWDIKTTITSKNLDVLPNRRIPKRFVFGNADTICGFLRGLYSANGSVCGNRITLKTTSFHIIQDVQSMLSAIGISSYFTTNKAKCVKFANGEYECKQSYDLNITHDRNKFIDLIGFVQTYKQDKAISSTATLKRNWTKTTYEVIKIEKLGKQPVFDIEVEASEHSYWTDGLLVSNCSEYMFLDDTACNLASINLIKFITETGSFDYQKFAKVCQLWQLVLEISVYMSQFPAHDIALNSYLYRTTGLGFANIGGMLMNMAIPYDSQEAMYLCSAISAIMTGAAYQQSVNMAKSLEPFRGYHENKASMLEVLHKHNAKIATTIGTLKADTFLEEHSQGIGAFAKELWENVVVNATKYGVRNAQVSVIAPTGTIGLLMDCDTTGIEPDFAIVKFKKLAGGGYMKIVNSTVDTALKRLGYSPIEIEEIETYATGTKALPNDVADLFMKMGATKEDIANINKKLVTAFDLNFVMNRTVLGDDLLSRIGADDKVDSAIDILRHVRFVSDTSKQSSVAINNLNNTIVGMMTLEGAPHLRHEHYPIFACASKTGTIGKQIISSMGHLNMMAAAQPFISGAISKTINLPHEATINDIDRVYRTAWRLGLKSIALYRDGSKLAQPLASSVLEAFDISKYELDENNVTAVKLMTEAIHKSTRRKLPSRRRGYTQKVKIANQALYIKTGEYGDGTLGEIFLDVNKEGASFRAMMNSFAIAVSIGLQYGVPLEEFVDAFVNTRFEPAGIVTGNDCIKMSSSIVDYIFRELAISYLDRAEDFAQVKPQIDLPVINPLPIKEGFNRGIPRTVKEEKRPQLVSHTAPVTPAVAHAIETQDIQYAAAKSRGYTGDSCPSCGSMTMVRNGTCLKCENCGTTTGCS